ncbi:MAG TPA: hypothetical protein VKU62_02050 [Thermoanaerobaculia bacterium]|nr:hypothetical protein [Thermoanaerobaculia bacterium]
MNTDPVRKLDLRQFSLTAELPDFSSDEFELGWLVHEALIDFYATEK